MNLVVKEPKSKLRKRIRLPNDGSVVLNWALLLDSVQKEFAVESCRIRLSLNHGKTFVEADADTTLADVGIVNGDILTLVSTNDQEGQKVVSRSENQPLIVHQEVERAICQTNTPDCIQLEAQEMPSENSLSRNQEPMNSEPIISDEPERVNQYLTMPILLRDVSSSELPLSFNQLLSDNPTSNSVSQLVLALHTLLQESGFTFIGDSTSEVPLLKQVCCKGDLYKLKYSHSLSADFVVDVVCVHMGSRLAIHGIVKSSKNINLSLLVTKFVNTDGLLKNRLSELSHHFKDMFVAPLIIIMKEVLNIEALPPLLDLPYELIMLIFNKLDYKSVCRLGRTCSQLSRMYKDNSLWKRLFLRQYRGSRNDHFDGDQFWYDQFKLTTLESIQLANITSRFPPPPDNFGLPPWPPVSPFPPYGIPPIWDDPANQGIPHPNGIRPLRRNVVDVLSPTIPPPRKTRHLLCMPGMF